MRTPAKVAAVLTFAVAAFLGGTWYARRDASTAAAQTDRKISYYACPMHPQFKSQKPGDCPSCGMRLEPVYADAGTSSPIQGSTGGLQVSPEKQQAIGLRTVAASSMPARQSLRAPGRIVADETRIYKVNATVDGWIQEIGPATTGSLVRQGEVLASYYAPEFLAAQQAYLYALGSLDRFQATGKETPDQIRLTNANIQQAKDSLAVLGMSDAQADEMAKTRELSQRIRIVSPATGFITNRDVSRGQRFERGTEFFRIADLARVWVVADVFENEVDYFRPGQSASVSYQRKSFTARVSDAPPVFDATTRTMKLRLEIDNPNSVLRPDMFVEVEFSINLPPAITVPVDAVIDSGLKQTVFVSKGGGYFEPRTVETGWRFGDQVEIVRGLAAGEQIVVSGNFMLDSESRMRMTASQGGQAMERPEERAKASLIDPVCGMDVNPASAMGRSEYKGKTYYFCSDQCKRKFAASPEAFIH